MSALYDDLVKNVDLMIKDWYEMSGTVFLHTNDPRVDVTIMDVPEHGELSLFGYVDNGGSRENDYDFEIPQRNPKDAIVTIADALIEVAKINKQSERAAIAEAISAQDEIDNCGHLSATRKFNGGNPWYICNDCGVKLDG